MVHIVTLINFKIHAFMQNQVSLKPLKQPLLMINKFILLIVRELNRYYVGTVASSEVPSSKSLKILKHHNLLLKHSQVLETLHNNTQLNFSLTSISYGNFIITETKTS